MSEDLANQLIEAGSAETFLRTRSEATDWRIVASLKTEVDRLVACDLNQAERLADRVCALASVIGDPLSGAFADAIRARVLDNLGRYSESDGLYERAAVVMRGARLTREAAIVQKQQITPLVHLGLYGPALQKARGARRVLARTEPLHYAQLEANIGNIYYRLDQYGSALAHYERARDLVASSGDEAML
ncbi:MAG TPA: tetratricopeptide repeat protein, partial [Blastocatellia bacterium]|nr:tetratricopeptide repeat protein [Blastocatellia bacterium]